MLLNDYDPEGFYDELFETKGVAREQSRSLIQWMQELGIDRLKRHRQTAEIALYNLGITFNVYGDRQGVEKIFPFDIIPRIISADEWTWIERGLQQRIKAINCFISDIYGKQEIVSEGIIPENVIKTAPGYLEACQGIEPRNGVWCHISGSDLVRDSDGQWYVLEDNIRVPSGVSYVLENRRVMKATSPIFFRPCR